MICILELGPELWLNLCVVESLHSISWLMVDYWRLNLKFLLRYILLKDIWFRVHAYFSESQSSKVHKIADEKQDE